MDTPELRFGYCDCCGEQYWLTELMLRNQRVIGVCLDCAEPGYFALKSNQREKEQQEGVDRT